ncbi:MAG: glycosyltransferase family 2 protein, partial [Patescibacteria group bacterium]
MISAVVLTKNEEKNIVDCLESLSWCDEIIVVDDNSEDRTAEISKKFSAKVFIRNLNSDFSKQRNFGLEKASGDWILFVDADERVTPLLRKEIIQSTNNPINQYDGFYIKRKDFMWEKELKYGETGNVVLLRLARENKGEWEGKVHEEWKVKGSVGEFKNSILHYPHPTISEFLKEINYYTDIRAKELFEKG